MYNYFLPILDETNDIFVHLSNLIFTYIYRSKETI